MKRWLVGLILTVCLLTAVHQVEAQVEGESAWQKTPTGRADAWVLFEQKRDRHTRRAEKIFGPVSLGVLTGIGAAFAATSDVPVGSRIAFATAGALSGAAILPTVLSTSRDRSRAWFTSGISAFLVGAGVGMALIDRGADAEQSDGFRQSGRWIGTSVALQGLILLPVGFLPGFPPQQDYDMYWKLPASERPQAAARILRQIDRFEQRATAISLLTSLAGAVVLSVGVLAVDNRDARRELAAFSLAPLGSALLGMVPRLFAGSRLERFATGQPPQRLSYNAW